MKVLVLIAATIGSILILTQASPCTPPDSSNSERCPIPCLDGVFVLDVSKSIGNQKNGAEPFNLMRNFILSTFDLVTISPNCSRAGLIIFANEARIEFNLNSYTDEASLMQALNDVTLKSIKKFRQDVGTNTPEVLTLLRTAAQDGSLGLNNEERIQIAVIITDGRPHIPATPEDAEAQTEEAGRLLRKAEIYERIYAIGVQGKGNKPIDRDALKLITGDTELTFLVANFSTQAFEQVTAGIREEFCNNSCVGVQCPFGSRCRLWNETRTPYCEYSCDVDNGGCGESQCIEVNVSTCTPGQCCSPVNVTCQKEEENCTIEGQMYSEEAPPPEHQPTCNKPNRAYCPTAAPRPGCVCPNGTVIDDIQKRCVPLPECTCPPQCSHDYCSSAKSNDTLIPCMRGFPPYTEADCTDDCKKTNCQLCDYYYRSPTDDPVYICI